MRPAFVGLLRATFLLAGAALMLMSQLSHADEHVIDTKQGSIKVETVADGLDYPWGIAFLPDGRMLVTERPGRLRIVARFAGAQALVDHQSFSSVQPDGGAVFTETPMVFDDEPRHTKLRRLVNSDWASGADAPVLPH